MRVDVPDWIRDAPQLAEGLDFYLDAFVDLSGDRTDRTRRIPWASMDAYGRRYGLEGDDWEDFHHLVSALDAVFVEHWRTKTTPGDEPKETEDGEP